MQEAGWCKNLNTFYSISIEYIPYTVLIRYTIISCYTLPSIYGFYATLIKDIYQMGYNKSTTYLENDQDLKILYTLYSVHIYIYEHMCVVCHL